MINCAVKNPLSHCGVGMGLHVWWIRGKGPGTAVGASPPFLWQVSPAHLPLPLSHPLSTVHTPSVLSQPHLWRQIDSQRNPQLLAVFFQLCYSVSIFILWFLTSREKQRELFFPPLPCRGLSRFWTVWNDLARGWRRSQVLTISLCIRGAGWVKYFISCQQNPVLFRFHGRRKKRK